jgi:hypothetical protein
MKKLEFKDVSGYLPYDLACMNEDGYIEEIHELNYGELLRYINPTETDITDYVMKPILRPLSDLYKTIKHNGKEIIPIVECAKIIFPFDGWIVDGWKALSESKMRHFDFCFANKNFYQRINNGDDNYIRDVIPLFDFLHELKIDYRNLIYDGLAIDANTLDANPYK